jgi:hypothetical protein
MLLGEWQGRAAVAERPAHWLDLKSFKPAHKPWRPLVPGESLRTSLTKTRPRGYSPQQGFISSCGTERANWLMMQDWQASDTAIPVAFNAFVAALT